MTKTTKTFIVLSFVLFAINVLQYKSKKITYDRRNIVELPKQTISFKDKEYVPIVNEYIKYKTKYKTDTLKIDTAKLLADYLSTRISIDTVANDSNAFILIRDSISRNRIQGRKVTKRYFVHRYLIKQKPTWHLYGGAELTGGKSSLGFSPSLLYQSKNNKIFGFSYDLIRKEVSVSAYIRLK